MLNAGVMIMKNSASWGVIAIALLLTTAQSADKSLVDSSFFKDSQAEISLKIIGNTSKMTPTLPSLRRSTAPGDKG